MLALSCGAIWAILVFYLLSRVLRQFRAHNSSALEPAPPSARSQTVSIIVPVRNEIANIAHCLQGLTAQRGIADASSIIVVDDESEDGTRAAVEEEIARGAPLMLASAGELPEGWI